MIEEQTGEFTNSPEVIASEFLKYGSRQDRLAPWPTYRFDGDRMTFAVVNNDNVQARNALDFALRDEHAKLQQKPTAEEIDAANKKALSSEKLTFAEVLLLTADGMWKDFGIPNDDVRWELVKRAERASSQLQTIMDAKMLGRKIDETPEMQLPELPNVRNIQHTDLIIGKQSLARFKSELTGRKSAKRPVRG